MSRSSNNSLPCNRSLLKKLQAKSLIKYNKRIFMENNKKRTGEAKLMKGNEALAEAAIRADIDAYFGYPITPQSEVLGIS
ncbi:MAG: hypothetical protein MZV64_05980 [Ignavibacteriales bacterium]|nr:hypothetical protein [Ignavibacteriales bacterium]